MRVFRDAHTVIASERAMNSEKEDDGDGVRLAEAGRHPRSSRIEAS